MLSTSIVDRFIVTVAPMIDRAQWRVPWDVLTVVAVAQAEEPDGWCRLSRRDLARKAGCSDGRVWELVGNPGELCRINHVLQRGQRGAGRRPSELRVVLDIDKWRGVPWKESDAELRGYRLQAGLEPALEAMDASLALTAFWRGLLPRQRGGLVARSITAPRRVAADLGNPLRDNEPTPRPAGLYGAVLDRATTDPSMVSVPVADRATTSGPGAPSTSPRGVGVALGGVRSTDLSAVGPEREQGNGSGTETGPLVDRLERVIAAINANCRAKGMKKTVYRGSSLEARLRRLAATVDLDVLLAGVEDTDPADQPPAMVTHLEAIASGSISLGAAGGNSGTTIEARLRNLDRLIATYQLDGEPVEDLVAERRRWQDELNQRKELTGGPDPAASNPPVPRESAAVA